MSVASYAALLKPGFVLDMTVAVPWEKSPCLRRSPWTAALLDGVNIAALGLMAGVTLELAQSAIVDWLTVALAIAAAALLFRFKLNSAWLVLGGAAVGVVAHLLA